VAPAPEPFARRSGAGGATAAEILDDLAERCWLAESELRGRSADTLCAEASERYYAKAEGVRLALSYIEEARRMNAAESLPSADGATGRAPARPTITT
jgi:hypothetical protein